MQKPSPRALLAAAGLALGLAGCAAGPDPAHRYDAAQAQMQHARDGVQEILRRAEAQKRDAVRRSNEATENYRRVSGEVFAADHLDRKLHPERYRGHVPPPSLEYRRTMSGERDREDDAQRAAERDRLRAVQDAATRDTEWEIERGQIETRYGVWPDECAYAGHARRRIDCGH